MFEFDPSKQILFEDNHLVIINKLPAQIIQGDKTGDTPLSESIKEYLKEKYNKPGRVFLGVVHRIDRPASGAVIFARTSKALARLNEMLRKNEIRKTYWIITAKKPDPISGTLEDHLWKYEKKNKSFVVAEKKKGAKKAVLNYTLKQSVGNSYLIEVELQTGRHHQIRVQFGNIGCPVMGDVKYGYPNANEKPFIHLHARQLSFIHPVTKKNMTLSASPPPDKHWDQYIDAE